MAHLLWFAAGLAVFAFLFLRTSPGTQAPVVPAGTDWFHTQLLKLTAIWTTHGQTWKRWVCFVAGWIAAMGWAWASAGIGG